MKQLGKYEILEKIGEGGFGVVYRGRDPLLDRIVAIKTCASDAKKIRKRFFREAEISGRLRHPNVVTVHDFGVEDGTPYLVQEFLPGRDLDHIIEEQPDTPLGIKLRFLRGISEGLHYAHGEGVIHRDVKPANVRVVARQRVKVMDFGIAKIKGQHSKLTDTGLPVGTVAYLSPEQLSDTGIDQRCDIFAFGVLAYEVLAGKRPFRATSVHALFYQLLNEEAQPLSEVVPEVPVSLAALVAKCLDKNRDRRYSSFAQIIDELEVLQQQIPGAWERTEQAILLSRLSSRAQEVDVMAARAKRALAAGDAGEAQTAEFEKPVSAADLAEPPTQTATASIPTAKMTASIPTAKVTTSIPINSAANEPPQASADEAAEVEATEQDSEPAQPEVPKQFLPLAHEVEEHLDSGEFELAALAFIELEQKARGGSFLDRMRTRLDAGFRSR